MSLKRSITVIGFLVLAGCSNFSLGGMVPDSRPADPLENIETLDDVMLAEQTEVAAIADSASPDSGAGADSEAEAAPGLFSTFMSRLTAPTDPQSTAEPAAAAGRSGGLFGLGARPAPPRDGPDAQIIAYGDRVAFGQIATVCDMPSGRLGTRVGSIAGFDIYDPVPNSTALRPHYISGFPDGCVRQFAAALALTGDIGTHELVRYSSANRRQSYSATDNAYEAIKASFCRAGHGDPCGAKLDALSNTTGFLSVYEKFGGNGSWVEILLHDERVIAIDKEDL